MSSGALPIRDVIAVQQILQTHGRWESHYAFPQYPSPTGGGAGLIDMPEQWRVGGVNLKAMSCIGCTGPARVIVGQLQLLESGSLTLTGSAVSTATAEMYWGVPDERLMTITAQDSGTPGQLPARKSALTVCTDLLLARRGLLSIEQVSAIQRQLQSLLGTEDDEFESRDTAISPISLDGLIEFLARNNPDSHPNISLSRDGRFMASWSHGKRAKITLIFDREGGDWVGVDLDTRPPIRDAGAFVVNSLFGITKPFRSWIKA